MPRQLRRHPWGQTARPVLAVGWGRRGPVPTVPGAAVPLHADGGEGGGGGLAPPQSRAGLAGEVLEDALVRVVVAVVVVGQDARVVGALHVPAQRFTGALWGWQSGGWVQAPCTLSPLPSTAHPREPPPGAPSSLPPSLEGTKCRAALSLALGTMPLPPGAGADAAQALSSQPPGLPTPTGVPGP